MQFLRISNNFYFCLSPRFFLSSLDLCSVPLGTYVWPPRGRPAIASPRVSRCNIIINGSSSSSRSAVTMKAALLYLAQVKAVPLSAWRQSIRQSVTSSFSVNRHVLSPQFLSSKAFRNIFDQCGISVFSFVFAVCVAHKFRTYVFRHFLLWLWNGEIDLNRTRYDANEQNRRAGSSISV